MTTQPLSSPERLRLQLALLPSRRSELGQFMTQAIVAAFIAAWFPRVPGEREWGWGR